MTLTFGVLLAPFAAEAQQAGRTYRLGILQPTVPRASSDQSVLTNQIVTALGPLGYVEGQNLVVEQRFAEGKLDRLPALARRLVQLRVDAIIAVGNLAIRAAREATPTVPIVMFTSDDPVQAGFVASLAHPGGNITGVLIAAEGTLAGKRLELIKEAVPPAARIALLACAEPSARAQVQEAQKAAPSLGVTLVVVEVRDGEYERAFARMMAARVRALFVLASAFFNVDRRQVIDLAARHRLPAIHVRGPDGVWQQLLRTLAKGGGLRRSDLQGSQACGSADRAAHHV
jgi:putative ABC transport system substrate-binding protein